MTPPAMTQSTPTAQSRSGPGRRDPLVGRRSPIDSIAAVELIYKRILQANLAVLRQRQLDERRQRQLERLIALWPLWLGLLLGAFAPQLQEIAHSFGPWGMPLIFPFVELANRPEVQVGGITHLLPQFMLFAQFPLEGLLARFVLKRGLRPMRVAAEVALLHSFAIFDLWLLSAGSVAILRH